MADLASVESVRVMDIANPGYGPIFAVCIKAKGREWVLTHDRALFRDEASARRLARKVEQRGEANLDLWDAASMTEDERVQHWADMAEWEHFERLSGRDY